MNNLFVPYDLALKLKEKEFDEPCHKVYDTKGFLQDEIAMDQLSLEKIPAPLYQQVIQWFRMKHNIVIEARLCSYSISLWEEKGESNFKFRAKLFTWKDGESHYGDFNTPEEALIESIKRALKKI